MKSIRYIILGFLAICFFASCSDDFLDRNPKEEIGTVVYWQTPLDAEMFVADLYRSLPGASSGNVDRDTYSDNAAHGIKWAAGNISKGIYDPTDKPINDAWKDAYEAIRKANLLLEKIELIPNYNKEDKDIVIAEARFFRGYHYFVLIRAFGDVPYIDKVLLLEDLNTLTRTPWQDIYKKVMEDFDYATSKLPLHSERKAAEYGRVTKGAAYSIKARAALYFGDKVADAWKTAAAAADSVIVSEQYELLDKNGTQGIYAELFWERQERCKEAILVRQFKADYVKNNIVGWGCFPTKGWGGINPTKSLVDAFECTDGGPITGNALYNPKDPFKNRDARCEVAVLHDGEQRYGVTIRVAPTKKSGNTGIGQHGDATATGYYNDKYLDPSIADPSVQGWNMGKDWHDVRYAEVLLTYAEAKNKIAPLDATALDAVNQVRKRVGQPLLQTTDNTKPTYVANGAALDERIRNEWRVEFALEGGKRQWDVRRWGIAKTVLNQPFLGINYRENPVDTTYILYEGDFMPVAGEYGGYKDHNYIWPVPQVERDLNSKLTQNDGYN